MSLRGAYRIFHHAPAGRVVALVHRLDAVEAQDGEAFAQHRCQRFGHQSAVPAGAGERIAEFHHAVRVAVTHEANRADDAVRFAQHDAPTGRAPLWYWLMM